MRVVGPPVLHQDRMLWVGDYPRHGARRFPDRLAIVDDAGALSYTELDRATERFADHLLRLGLPPGSRIGYLGKNSALLFPVFFGCIRAGMVLVPLNWRYAPKELGYVLADAGIALLIHTPEFAGMVGQATTSLPTPPLRMETEGGVDPAATLRAVYDSALPPPPRPALQPDACALQLYTSGTTGQPKGVMVSHRALTIARWIEIDSPHWTDWTDDDIILSGMPNFHSGGLSWMLIGLLRSLTCILTADPSPGNLLALSRRHAVTRTFIVPAVVRVLLASVLDSGEPAPRLKTIFYGAAPMDADLIKRCLATFGCGFAQYYGMTEATGSVTFFPPAEHDVNRPERLRSVGSALPGFEIEIRSADGQVLGAGQHGEIWIRSPTLMLGYWNKPQASAEVLVDGWYRSGDGGYLDDEGYLYITDRVKDMIISGGENIYPVEVEQALRLHPAVNDVVVIGAPDATWGEAVTAIVEWRPGQTASLEELRTFAREHVAGYKLPKRLGSMEQLPRTPTGKLQRGEVRRQMLPTLAA